MHVLRHAVFDDFHDHGFSKSGSGSTSLPIAVPRVSLRKRFLAPCTNVSRQRIDLLAVSADFREAGRIAREERSVKDSPDAVHVGSQPSQAFSTKNDLRGMLFDF